VLGFEHPFDAGALFIALYLPFRDFECKLLAGWDPSIEALASQDSDLVFDHVEPTGVLWGEMEFQAPEDAPGLGRRQGVVKRSRAVG
jgi:hypothetical protein